MLTKLASADKQRELKWKFRKAAQLRHPTDWDAYFAEKRQQLEEQFTELVAV